MNTKYKFIEFEYDKDAGFWECFNIKHSDLLGSVEWYRVWKKWVFCSTDEEVLFSADCLADISHFMKQLPKKP